MAKANVIEHSYQVFGQNKVSFTLSEKAGARTYKCSFIQSTMLTDGGNAVVDHGIAVKEEDIASMFAAGVFPKAHRSSSPQDMAILALTWISSSPHTEEQWLVSLIVRLTNMSTVDYTVVRTPLASSV